MPIKSQNGWSADVHGNRVGDQCASPFVTLRNYREVAVKPFFLRRLAMTLMTVVIVAGILARIRLENEQLGHGSFWGGYLLLAAIFCLALFNWRKKLSFLPLGSASAWLQAHIYVALGTVPIFLQHVGWRWPNGILETTLFGLYALTTFSGMVGLYWTRQLPRRLSKLRQEVIYEQIPIYRRQVQLSRARGGEGFAIGRSGRGDCRLLHRRTGTLFRQDARSALFPVSFRRLP